MTTLRELYEERLARLRQHDEKPRPAKRRDPGPPSATSESPAEAWLAERSVNPDSLCAGELVNMLEGLTPSGKDRQGRQVSFIERGRARRGISESPRRIADD